jgi:phosphate transport system protein
VTNDNISKHISGQFNFELENVRNKVLIMGGIAEQQIEQAITAFKNKDAELAERVIKQNNQIDELEMEIDKECTQIMAQRQPEAFDLRLLITVIKIIHEIECIGDYVSDIAKLTINSRNCKNPVPHYELDNLANLVKKMLHDSLNAFARITLEDVSAIFQQIHAVNHEYDNIFRQLITRMMENPQNISWTLDVVWAIRGLERIGDHSCYICKHLTLMIKGEDALVSILQKAENKPFEGGIGIS